MEGRKYFLSRKWFRTSYAVTDESGKVYCHLKRRGFLVYEIYLYNVNGEKMVTAFQEEADLASYTFFGQDGYICKLVSDMFVTKYSLRFPDGRLISVPSMVGWVPDDLPFVEDGIVLAKAKPLSRFYNKIELTIGEGKDSYLYLAVVVAIVSCRGVR